MKSTQVDSGFGYQGGQAFTAALHPALLRVNQLTDTSGLKVYTYVRQTDNRFLTKDIGTPPLSMQHPPEYWGQFLPGSTHEFELRMGGLGFWQVNEIPLREMYRDYYEALRKKRKKSADLP